MFSNRYPIIVLYAIGLHLIQATALFASHATSGVTSVAAVESLLDGASFLTPYIFLAVAVMAAIGLMVGRRRFTVALMLPQQFLLFIAAYGSLACILTGRFADGVERSSAFLLADQSPAILAAIGHTVAIVALIEKKTWDPSRG